MLAAQHHGGGGIRLPVAVDSACEQEMQSQARKPQRACDRDDIAGPGTRAENRRTPLEVTERRHRDRQRVGSREIATDHPAPWRE